MEDEEVRAQPRKRGEQVGEKMPRRQAREENEESRLGAQEILPRKRDERVPDDVQKLPRKQSVQILGDISSPDDDPDAEPERQPGKNDEERIEMDGRLTKDS